MALELPSSSPSRLFEFRRFLSPFRSWYDIRERFCRRARSPDRRKTRTQNNAIRPLCRAGVFAPGPREPPTRYHCNYAETPPERNMNIIQVGCRKRLDDRRKYSPKPHFSSGAPEKTNVLSEHYETTPLENRKNVPPGPDNSGAAIVFQPFFQGAICCDLRRPSSVLYLSSQFFQFSSISHQRRGDAGGDACAVADG